MHNTFSNLRINLRLYRRKIQLSLYYRLKKAIKSHIYLILFGFKNYSNHKNYQLQISKQALDNINKLKLAHFLSSPSYLEFPKIDNPEVSIILILYNQIESTLKCLLSILNNDFKSYEIIIVDNNSQDQTLALIRKIKGIKKKLNNKNIYYLQAFNKAANESRGKYLLFLTNDTEIFKDAIVNSVKTIESDQSIGAVGGKIILSDGSLQEAGSIIWKDGSCLGYGRGEAPLSPQYNYKRDVDYCSGCFLLTSKELFDQLGGFDEDYQPAYYEETDYCVKIWKAGKRVVYEPTSMVFHYEFGSSKSQKEALDLQIRNQNIFIQKHPDWLNNQLLPSSHNIWKASNRKKIKGRILVIDDMTPHSYLGSGYPRANFIINTMIKLNYAVTFYPVLPTVESWDSIYEDISPEIEVIKEGEACDLEDFLNNRVNDFDIIFISRPHNMSLFRCLQISKKLFENKKIIYDAEALFSSRIMAFNKLNGIKISSKQQSRIFKQELNLALDTSAIVSVSKSEAEKFIKFGYDAKNTYIIGHANSILPTTTDFNLRKDILFVGSIHDLNSPNADSVIWFAQKILPIIHSKLNAQLKFIVAGFNKVDEIYALANDYIKILGKVDDLRPLYEKARLFVAPTRFSAGIPLKVYEAAAHGLPVVTTCQIAHQLIWNHEIELLMADDAETFASQCIELYQNFSLWFNLRQNALNRVTNDCCPIKLSNTLETLLNKTLAD